MDLEEWKTNARDFYKQTLDLVSCLYPNDPVWELAWKYLEIYREYMEEKNRQKYE